LSNFEENSRVDVEGLKQKDLFLCSIEFEQPISSLLELGAKLLVKLGFTQTFRQIPH